MSYVRHEKFRTTTFVRKLRRIHKSVRKLFCVSYVRYCLIKKFLQSVLTVREQSWRRGLRMYERSVLFGSRWWRTCWLLYKTVMNSTSSKSSTSCHGDNSEYVTCTVYRRTWRWRSNWCSNTLRVRCTGAPDDDAVTEVTRVNKQNGVSYVLLTFQLLNSNFINFSWLHTNFS